MASPEKRKKRLDPLDRAFERLQDMLPEWMARVLAWLHTPQSRYVRLPLGIAMIILSAFFFLPGIGLHFLPIGLLLIAQDIPFLRKPVGKAMNRLLDWGEGLVRKWKARRAHVSMRQ